MQLFVKIKLEEPLDLPIAYHHIVHGIIYNQLKSKDPAFSAYMHDTGYECHNRQYKLFCFSSLHGKHRVDKRNGRIVFFESLNFEIRSPDTYLINVLRKAICEQGITFGKRMVEIDYIKVTSKTIDNEKIYVEMLSPVTVHRTDCQTKKRMWPNPLEKEFAELIIDNARRKYKAFAGVPPKDDLRIEAIAVGIRDKYVTRIKKKRRREEEATEVVKTNGEGQKDGQEIDNRITAWRGIYCLAGPKDLLSFLYDAGIGSNNSMGFGMFGLLEEGRLKPGQ